MMSRLELAIEQVVFGRNYTLRLLANMKGEDWFRQSPGGVTHIAWQVGHLAVAEYWLAMVRIRGERPEDENLIPKASSDRSSANLFPISIPPSALAKTK